MAAEDAAEEDAAAVEAYRRKEPRRRGDMTVERILAVCGGERQGNGRNEAERDIELARPSPPPI